MLLVGAPKTFAYQALLGDNFGAFAGIELLLAGFGVFMGTLVVRFGNKPGVLAGMLYGAFLGGMSMAVIDLVKGDVNAMPVWISGSFPTDVNVISAVYLFSGIFAVRMTRKIEARL